jgi:hypothetical protein
MAALTECSLLDNIVQPIISTIVNKKSLLHVLKVILNSINYVYLDEHIDMLVPYVNQYKLSKKDILKLSHVFCNCCTLYKPSLLCTWAEENPELFDTEVFIFNKFFRKFTSLKKDVSVYPLEELFTTDRLPVFEQSKKEKLKILNTVISYYDLIIAYHI